MADTSWHTDDYPELRAAPPWVMQEMIAAQPALAEQLLASPPSATDELAALIRAALAAREPVTVVGCGSSEHAALGIAALLAAAVDPAERPLVRARPAMTALLEPAAGVCVAVSHDGGTRATELAARAARRAGARVAAITHATDGSVAAAADLVLPTPRHDDSWCHTVAYTSALVAGAAIARALGAAGAEPGAVREAFATAVGLDAAPLAARLAGSRVVLCAGTGADHVTARELALKIAEGARLPTLGLELETVLHGQLAGHQAPDALVLVATQGGDEADRLARRLEHVARAAGAVGLPVAALLTAPYDQVLAPELTPAGRLLLSAKKMGPGPFSFALGSLVAGAGALQLLTLELAHARGTNPDLIRREEEPYRRAALAAEDVGDW